MGCELGNYRTATLHTFICGGCPTAEQFFYKTNMENRDSCVFYASWLDAIEAMPDNVRGEALMAILVYALRGETTEKMGAMTKVIMAMVKPQIEANNKRYENGCKGGRPKVEKNQTVTKPKPNQNQNETKKNQTVTYNDNVNDNVNVNDNESVCDKSHNNAPTHTLTHEEEIFNQFNEYCRVVAPLAIAFKEPLSLKDFEWLYKTFGSARIKKCAEELHNKEAYKKNRRAITAWKAFIGKIS
jgi:hypothetical protein